MDYQKKKKILRQCTKSTVKFRTKNWVEINGGARGKYNTNSQINVKVQC